MRGGKMRKSEFILIFGLIILGYSVRGISLFIYNLSWRVASGGTINWIYVDTLMLLWHILAPIVVLGVGLGLRYRENRQQGMPIQIAKHVSQAIDNIKFCMKCGNQNPKKVQFCFNCGTKFPD